jgi:LysR family cys regulon transcriptional activator
MAFDAKRDSHLRVIDAGHLFRSSTTRVALRRGAMMRGYAYEFIELFAPQLTRKTIDKAMSGGRDNYEL